MTPREHRYYLVPYMSVEKDVERKLIVAGVGRFQVMALLQAARHYILYRDLDKAKSFGLNRAIFYAWAKYHGPHTMAWRMKRLEEILRTGALKPRRTRCPEDMEEVLGECVEVSPNGLYVIGGKEQTPRDYDDNVAKKISRVIDYEKAWKAALDYVGRFPEWVLRDQQKFYKIVYEPVRDTFFKQLLIKGSVEPPEDLLKRIESMEKMYGGKKQRSLFEYMSK